MWRKGNPLGLLVRIWRIAQKFLKKLKLELPNDSAILLLGCTQRKP